MPLGWSLSPGRLVCERVDMDAGEVRLDAGTTKNGDGRAFPFTAELGPVLEDQQQLAERLKRSGVLTPSPARPDTFCHCT